MANYNETVEKLAKWLCIQKNYNWDCIADFRRNQLTSEIIKLLHDNPEIKIEEVKNKNEI